MARTTPVHSGYTIINGAGTGTNGKRIDVWVEYKVVEQDIANNKSRIIAYFYACLNPAYSSSTWGSRGCYSAFSVGGVSGTDLKKNGSYDFRSSSKLNLMGTFDGWVAHNQDGSKTISIAGSFTTDSDYISGGNVSGNVVLPRIPRGCWVREGMLWRQALIYANVGGQWKQCLGYVNSGGVWKQGV